MGGIDVDGIGDFLTALKVGDLTAYSRSTNHKRQIQLQNHYSISCHLWNHIEWARA